MVSVEHCSCPFFGKTYPMFDLTFVRVDPGIYWESNTSCAPWGAEERKLVMRALGMLERDG